MMMVTATLMTTFLCAGPVPALRKHIPLYPHGNAPGVPFLQTPPGPLSQEEVFEWVSAQSLCS